MRCVSKLSVCLPRGLHIGLALDRADTMGRRRIFTSSVSIASILLMIIRTHGVSSERHLQQPQLTRAIGLEVPQQMRPEAFNHLMVPVTTLRGGSSDRHEVVPKSSSGTGLRHCAKVLYETLLFDFP